MHRVVVIPEDTWVLPVGISVNLVISDHFTCKGIPQCDIRWEVGAISTYLIEGIVIALLL